MGLERTFLTAGVILTAVQFVLMVLCYIRIGQCKVVVREVIKTIEETETAGDVTTGRQREIEASVRLLQPAIDRIGQEVEHLHTRLDVVETDWRTASSIRSVSRADRTVYRRRR